MRAVPFLRFSVYKSSWLTDIELTGCVPLSNRPVIIVDLFSDWRVTDIVNVCGTQSWSSAIMDPMMLAGQGKLLDNFGLGGGKQKNSKGKGKGKVRRITFIAQVSDSGVGLKRI